MRPRVKFCAGAARTRGAATGLGHGVWPARWYRAGCMRASFVRFLPVPLARVCVGLHGRCNAHGHAALWR